MIRKNCQVGRITIYDIIENDTTIGSIEFIEEDRYLENIYVIPECRGKGYLTQAVNYLGKPLLALPLHQHIKKFEHLGFSFFKQIGEDKYYKYE